MRIRDFSDRKYESRYFKVFTTRRPISQYLVNASLNFPMTWRGDLWPRPRSMSHGPTMHGGPASRPAPAAPPPGSQGQGS